MAKVDCAFLYDGSAPVYDSQYCNFCVLWKIFEKILFIINSHNAPKSTSQKPPLFYTSGTSSKNCTRTTSTETLTIFCETKPHIFLHPNTLYVWEVTFAYEYRTMRNIKKNKKIEMLTSGETDEML